MWPQVWFERWHYELWALFQKEEVTFVSFPPSWDFSSLKGKWPFVIKNNIPYPLSSLKAGYTSEKSSFSLFSFNSLYFFFTHLKCCRLCCLFKRAIFGRCFIRFLNSEDLFRCLSCSVEWKVVFSGYSFLFKAISVLGWANMALSDNRGEHVDAVQSPTFAQDEPVFFLIHFFFFESVTWGILPHGVLNGEKNLYASWIN